MRIEVLKGTYSICKVSRVPVIKETGLLLSVTVTEEEISVVCHESLAGNEVIKEEKGWKVFKIAEKLEFSMTGILSAITSPLAELNISVFALSTYDTDYFLVKEENADKTITVLAQKNYEIIG